MEKLRKLSNKYGIYMVFVVVFAAASLLSPYFCTTRNIINILRQVSVYGVLAFGMTIILINGMTDLSMGSVLAFAGIVGIDLFLKTHSFIIAILAAIVTAMACGAVNAFTITTFNLPPFIATLAMDLIARGSVYLYTGGYPIYQIGDFSKLSTGYVGILPIPVLIMFIIMLITWFILGKTRLGRRFYAVGGNAEAARASGIGIRSTKYKAWLISSAFVGVAGCLQMARINAGLPETGMGYHGDAIAAAVVGGTAFGGGVGTALGTLIGSLIIAILNNLLNLLGVQSYVQDVVRGLVIIAAVAWDVKGKNTKIRKVRKSIDPMAVHSGAHV